MNDLDFVTLVRSAVIFFILSLKVFAFVMLSKAMKAKNFGALPSSGYIFCTREIATILRLDFHSGSVGRLAESLKAVGIGYLVNLNHNINWRRGGASV
jgi:hypothetical protein